MNLIVIKKNSITKRKQHKESTFQLKKGQIFCSNLIWRLFTLHKHNPCYFDVAWERTHQVLLGLQFLVALPLAAILHKGLQKDCSFLHMFRLLKLLGLGIGYALVFPANKSLLFPGQPTAGAQSCSPNE